MAQPPFTMERYAQDPPPPGWGGVCEGGGYSILSLLLGETPTGVGCALRDQGAIVSAPCRPGETPTGVGRCLRAGEGNPPTNLVSDQPPPEWGGVCELSRLTLKLAWRSRNPHRSGVCFARSFAGQADQRRETPTEVGPPSLTTNFQGSCHHYSTQPAKWCKPKQNPRQGPGVAGRLGARSPGQNPAKCPCIAPSPAHLARPGCGRW